MPDCDAFHGVCLSVGRLSRSPPPRTKLRVEGSRASNTSASRFLHHSGAEKPPCRRGPASVRSIEKGQILQLWLDLRLGGVRQGAAPVEPAKVWGLRSQPSLIKARGCHPDSGWVRVTLAGGPRV